MNGRASVVSPPLRERPLNRIASEREVGATLGWALLCALAPLGALWSGRVSDSPPPDVLSIVVGAVLPVAAGLCIPLFIGGLSGRSGDLAARLRLSRSFRTVLRHGVAGFGFGSFISLPMIGVTALALNVSARLGFSPAGQDSLQWIFDPATQVGTRVALVLVAVLLAPLGEELLHRALLFDGLVGCGARVGSAAVLSSLLFSALHLSLPHLVPLFLLALLFCAAYRRGGLAASVGTHMGINTANLVLGCLFFDA